MTPIAPHITAFLRERLPLQRGASVHTCESYAYTFQLLFEFASIRFKVTPSKLNLEQIDAPLVMDFLGTLNQHGATVPAPAIPDWQRLNLSCASLNTEYRPCWNKVCGYWQSHPKRPMYR